MKHSHFVLALSLSGLAACDRNPSSSSDGRDQVQIAARFQAGATVPSVGWVEAKLVRPARDSQVRIASYDTAKGKFLTFQPIERNDSFQLSLTGFDSIGSARVVRWWTTQGGSALQSPIQAVSLGAIDSLATPNASLAPTSLFVGATFALPGNWNYTTDDSDPRISATTQIAPSSLTVSVAGTVCIAHSSQSPGGPVVWSQSSCWNFTGLDTTKFMADRAGKVYPVVQIGTQKWMAENLDWVSDSSWCFDDQQSRCDLYGRLYAWSQASKACPAGWHLPSRLEWATLVGSSSTAALKASTSWPSGEAGTNASRFAILPGNSRFDGGYDLSGGMEADFWSSSSASDPAEAYSVTVPQSNSSAISLTTYGKQNGYSVRCLAN